MKIFVFLLALLVFFGCDNNNKVTSPSEQQPSSASQQDTLVTELEGTWVGECQVTQSSNSVLTESVNEVIVYKSNTSTHFLKEYSDFNCQDQVYSVRILNTLSSLDTERVGETFVIGDYVITNNGVTVKELTYQTPFHYEIYDIFLLQNNNTTLLFGSKCVNSIITSNCEEQKPTELDYNRAYTKI